MELSMRRINGFISGGVSLLALTTAAYAEGASSRDSIIVTATKRNESLQDVPLSITALTDENLERLGAERLEDYLSQAPGVSFTSSGIVNAKPTIRGIATSSAPGQGQAPVGIYIDDLPSLSRAFPFATTDLRVFDLERVEILRGPQGTLFGSGSAGGAIRLISNKPNLEAFEAKADVGVASVKGGGVSQAYNSMLNIPIVDELAALRVVGYYHEEAGYIDNIAQGVEDTGERDSFGGRAMLSVHPTDALKLRFSGTYQKDKQDTTAPFGFYDPADGDIDEYNTIDSNDTDIETVILNFTGEYDFGSVNVFSSTSYGETKARLNKDNDAYVGFIASVLDDLVLSPSDEVVSGQDIDAKTISQEIRFTSTNDSPFQWLIGGFFLDQEFSVVESWTVPSLDYVPVNVIIGANTRELALFGEASYTLADRLTFTAGARLFNNKSDFDNISSILGDEEVKTARPAEETSVTPKFALAYEVSDEVNIYATAAKGYRVGRANFAIPDPLTDIEVPQAYESDELWNYEVGLKSGLMDNALIFNVALFYIDWKNIQMPRNIEGNVITDNAGNAESKGVELEIDYAPAEWLSFGGTYAYVDGEITESFEGSYANVGDVLPGSSKHSFSTHLELSKSDIFAGANGYLRMDQQYMGSRFQDLDNSDSFVTDDYSLINIRAGIEWQNYEIVLYAENLLDNRVALLQYDGDGFNVSHAQYTRPRTIGVTLRAEF